MIFIGDVHGKIADYLRIVKQYESSMQVGDFAVGFRNGGKIIEFPEISVSHQFIHGNHDNPDLCMKSPNCLGRFGYTGEVFFVSGAWSIDFNMRLMGVSWWQNEELSMREMTEAIALYEETKPSVVVSHDCPLDIYYSWYTRGEITETITNRGLHEMLEIHTPDIWVFGHHHRTYKGSFNGCLFHGLDELEVLEI